MAIATDIVQQYFNFSNQSDFTKIATLFHHNCTYYSANLGFFVGQENVIAMQSAFHGQYHSVMWTIIEMVEIKQDVIEITFNFKGLMLDGLEQNRQGREHVLICDGLIQHVAVGL